MIRGATAVAALLGIHPTTVTRLIARGDVHPRRERGAALCYSLDQIVKLAVATARPADVVSQGEAAIAIGVSRQCVSQMVQRGRLVGVRRGYRVWITCASLDAELAARGVK